MNGSGRMNMRLAGSYREDDRARAGGWRLRQVTTTATPDPLAVSPNSTRPAVRVVLAAIRRLVPHVA